MVLCNLNPAFVEYYLLICFFFFIKPDILVLLLSACYCVYIL
jgi:hypothetical protein